MLWFNSFLDYLTPWNVVLFTAVLFINWYWRTSHFPPGPRGVPLFGVLPFLGAQPQETFRKWALKYGPVMAVRMGTNDFVFLNTFNSIHEALVNQSEKFSNRPKTGLFDQVCERYGIVYTENSRRQKISKTIAVKCLKRCGIGTNKIEELINNEVKIAMKSLEAKQNQPISLDKELVGLMSNIITTIVVGKRFDYDDVVIKKLFDDSIAKPNDGDLGLHLTYFYDVLKHIPPFYGVNKRFFQSRNQFAEVCKQFVNDHQYNSEAPKNFIDVFLSEKGDKYENQNHLLTNKQLEVCVQDFIASGYLSLRKLLNWDILCLLSYPDYYEQVMKEINSVIGPHESPSMSHFKRMPLTQAFLQEVWRYVPIVPNAVLHLTTSDTYLNGYRIPKNTQIVPNIYACHLDPKTWKNPEIFDPQRHIDGDGNFVRSHKIIPCSIGPRYCLGRDILHVEEFIILASLLRKFTVSSVSLPFPSVKEGHRTFAPYKILLAARN